MLKRVTVLAATLAILAGVAALWTWSQRDDRLIHASPDAVGGLWGPEEQRELVQLRQDPPRTPIRTLEAAPEQATELAPAEAARYGQISGSVYTIQGTALPGHLLRFELQSEGVRESLLARSEDDGTYWVRRAKAGIWEVSYVLEFPRVPDPVLQPLGSVEVQPEEVAAFDAVLTGERELSGRFTLFLEGADGVVLELELRRRSEPNRVFGRAECVSYRRAAWKVDEAGSRPSGGAAPEESLPEVGDFRFVHLPADRYDLRIWLNRDEGLYLDRTVDVWSEDVTFPPEELTIDDFLVARSTRPAAEAGLTDSDR